MFRLAFIFLLLCRVAFGHVTAPVADVSTAKLTRTGTLTLGGNAPAPVLRYDSNGNLTNDGTRSFTYDAQEQLTSITVTNAATGGSARTEFVYDGLGRRRIQRDYAWSGGGFNKTNEVRFIYDGYLLVQERDTNNNVLVTYTRGLDLSGSLSGAGGIGGLLGRTDASGSAYYHADGIGNVTALIDSQQTMAARYLYTAFGGQVGKWGPLADRNAMQFSSMPRHASSGLSLYVFRAYDPSLQRWTQPDPIGEGGGISLYGFVGNNPISSTDPYGEEARTVGPITVPIPFTTPAYEKDAQSAHEAQHRADFLSGLPGWKKEQRGFAAEIPVWNQKIRDYEDHIEFLKKNRCRFSHGVDRAIPAYEEMVRQMRNQRALAESFANPDDASKEYWNANKRWYQKEIPVPKALPLPPRKKKEGTRS